MKKTIIKTIQLFIILMIFYFITTIYSKKTNYVQESNKMNIEEMEIKKYVAQKRANEKDIVLSQIEMITEVENVNSIKTNAIIDCNLKLNELQFREDKMQWYTEYKEIKKMYSAWLDEEKTIYSTFARSELDFLFQIVEAEVTGEGYFQSKVNVASVIFNRIKSDEFPDTLTSVLKEKYQFSTYSDGRYKKVKVTEETILACEYAFEIYNSVNGSLYFDSCNGTSWANYNKEYVFTDEVGHSFYK